MHNIKINANVLFVNKQKICIEILILKCQYWGNQKTGIGKMAIYARDLDYFLSCFSTDMDEVTDIWREHQSFLPIPALVREILSRKNYSPSATDAMLQIVDRSFPKDSRSGAFERQNFFYALADRYAETMGEPTALVEFDVGNCNGTGDYAGDEAVSNVIRYMRKTFEETLLKSGAKFVQSVDNAKNDDLKIIVTGLKSEQLTRALVKAQDTILTKFIVASNIPHSKYGDGERNGIGVGSGFVNLGRGHSPQAIQERLNLFIEKRKLEDSGARYEIRKKVDTSMLEPVFVRGMLSAMFEKTNNDAQNHDHDFPFDLKTVDHVANPFAARAKACDLVADQADMSDDEKAAFDQILSFYHSSEALTGAQRSHFLQTDMEWVRKQSGEPVTVLNVKVENCAGINKVLSHIHSAEMTKHFVEIVSDFLDRNFSEEASDLIYYIGRNSFNILVPSFDRETTHQIFSQYLQDEIDERINSKPCGEYFAQFGLDVPEHMVDVKVGDIPNLRGMEPGVLAINIESRDTSDFKSADDIVKFQNTCLAGHRQSIQSYPITLPEGLTYQDLEQGRSASELLLVLQEMAHNIIEKEEGGAFIVRNDNNSLPHSGTDTGKPNPFKKRAIQ